MKRASNQLCWLVEQMIKEREVKLRAYSRTFFGARNTQVQVLTGLFTNLTNFTFLSFDLLYKMKVNSGI